MNIGILGTGVVGQTLAHKLDSIGHTVKIGTRNVADLLARTETDAWGNPPFAAWHDAHPNITLDTFDAVAAHGEVLINATSGDASIAVLNSIQPSSLDGKILLDISNPLDFSQGFPPFLSVSNTDSLAEQIQNAFPSLKVVKTLNTLNAYLMVDPASLANGDHHIFVSGNDADAKAAVVNYLKEWFGWQHIIDLGDITTARGTEMLLPIWVRLMGALNTANFNFKIVQ